MQRTLPISPRVYHSPSSFTGYRLVFRKVEVDVTSMMFLLAGPVVLALTWTDFHDAVQIVKQDALTWGLILFTGRWAVKAIREWTVGRWQAMHGRLDKQDAVLKEMVATGAAWRAEADERLSRIEGMLEGMQK